MSSSSSNVQFTLTDSCDIWSKATARSCSPFYAGDIPVQAHVTENDARFVFQGDRLGSTWMYDRPFLLPHITTEPALFRQLVQDVLAVQAPEF